jgi:putative SOS response-associated peptidase YedK
MLHLIHDRQAIILEPREYAEWLNESERPPPSSVHRSGIERRGEHRGF